ncbi:MAG TPA: large exoprotein [Beutenbergiaceae bacterium]|nr:large exoprotein [Beutenbergiaceae bacterium]
MLDPSGYYGATLASAILMLFLTFVFAVALYVVSAYFLSKVFAKAGVEGSWRAWVPFYNMMVFSKLGDLSPWLVLYCLGGGIVLSWTGLGFLFSLAMLAVTGMAAYRVGLKLGAEPAMVALWLLPVVWLGLMGLGKASWNNAISPAPWAGQGFLEDRTTWAGVPAQTPTQFHQQPPTMPPPAPGTQGYSA